MMSAWSLLEVLLLFPSGSPSSLAASGGRREVSSSEDAGTSPRGFFSLGHLFYAVPADAMAGGTALSSFCPVSFLALFPPLVDHSWMPEGVADFQAAIRRLPGQQSELSCERTRKLLYFSLPFTLFLLSAFRSLSHFRSTETS